jgi:hypothetical protein
MLDAVVAPPLQQIWKSDGSHAEVDLQSEKQSETLKR